MADSKIRVCRDDDMKLNEICEVYSGYALKAFNDAEDGFPVIKIGNIFMDGTLNLEECQYTTDGVNEKYYSQRGDIYIALVIPVPPVELQNQFAAFVTEVNKSKVKVQKALDETQKLFDSLMQQYFG